MKLSDGAMRLLLAGPGCFLLTLTSLHLKNADGAVASVWMANALLIAFILLSPRKLTPLFLLTGLVANTLAGHVATVSAAPFLYALANTLEVAIIAIGFGRGADSSKPFFQQYTMARFLLWAGLLAPAVSAFPGGFIAFTYHDHSMAEAYGHWFLADGLGNLIFTPLFVAVMNGSLRKHLESMDSRRRIELSALMVLVAASTLVAFFSESDLLIFIVIAPMMLVAMYAGWLATTMALAIVVVIGGTVLSMGYGPPSLISHNSSLPLYSAQIFIATVMLIQMPVSAALARRQALIERLRESEQSLHLLASHSTLLLLAFDLEGRCTRAMGSNDLLLDLPTRSLMGASFSDLSNEGQYELQRAHEAALSNVEATHIAEFRTVKIRDAWLEGVFRAHFDVSGRCRGTIATIHDVTMRKNQELYLSRSATTDSLTGLLNRAGFRERLDHALLRAAPGTLSLAVIDVDRFKLINDNSGHQIGDTVLREIAQRISAQVRAGDAVCRMGGDEFVILLSTTNWDRVQEICQRIVTAVNADPILLPSGNSLKATISCGVTRFSEGQSADDFVHEADTALYQAKRAGRNQMVAA